MPTVFFQEPEETELEAAQRKVAELEAELGPGHLDLIEPLQALMLIHLKKEEFGKVEEVTRRALTTYEKALGPDHLVIAASINSLADFLMR